MSVLCTRRTANLSSRRAAHRARGLVGVALASLAGTIALGASGAAGWTQWGLGTSLLDTTVPVGHLVISEVMTGGASASDEFVEIYNPSSTTQLLDGLDLVYVTASGATITTKATWPAGSPGIGAGAHVLVANEAGAFAAVADWTYANGLSATGGSVALRIQGSNAAVDAVGWGTAASNWMEGSAAPAVALGHSLERLPGGASGSGHDTDQNAADFVDRAAPEPQNAGSPPIVVASSPTPSGSVEPSSPATPTPSGSATPPMTTGPTPAASPSGTPTIEPGISPTAMPTPTPQPATPTPQPATPTPQPPTPTATPAPLTVAAARSLPDGSVAAIEAVSLTDGAFTDGGGYVTDGSAGIAVHISGGTFPRGHLLRVNGVVDDRYHQRTLRADVDDIVVVAPAAEPEALVVATGTVGEALEGQLALVAGTLTSGPTQLSSAVAWDLDDGSGPVRVVVMDGTGIDLGSWQRGAFARVRGVVGQRDSSGTGTTGYRLQPRASGDVEIVTPSPSASASASPSPSEPEDPALISISAARDLGLNARARVRGVVTLPTGTLGDGTAAIQDASGAIILRLGDEAGELVLGQVVKVDGVRSTKSGMETLRVSAAPSQLGSAQQPEPARHQTGALGESQEAQLVVVQGAATTAPRRSSAQNVYFDVDDGSGPLRVYISPRTGIDTAGITLGTTLELVGVLGQETSGQQPERGYRLWPRRPGDVSVVASAGPSEPSPSPGALGSPTGGDVGSAAEVGGSQAATNRAAWPKAIPAPRLHAHRVAVTPPYSPSPATAPALTSARVPPPTTLPVLLALVAAAFAVAAALAAARPGLVDRLRASLAHRTDHVAVGTVAEPPDVERRETSVETTVARLVPLAVNDERNQPEPFPGTVSRSSVRGILPPT